jgi:hypothetical protein
MGTIVLRKPLVHFTQAQMEENMVWATADSHASAVGFEAGDIVQYVSARTAWDKADADDDVNATTILSVALDSFRLDPWVAPIGGEAVQGRDITNKFRRFRLKDVRLEINISSGQDLVEGNVGTSFGLLWDATLGGLVVSLADTTNAHFLIEGLVNPYDPLLGGAIGDKQVRVFGKLVSSRVD